MKKKIAIIGSGIAGLTLANFLQASSKFEFVVYEKERILNLNEGFGIQLSTNSVSVLNKIGFNQLDKNDKCHPSKLDFYSIDYNKICDLDLNLFNYEDNKYTVLKRSVLIKFLKEKLLSNSIIFGKKINNIEKKKDKINISFIDGSVDEVDYLVISEGVYSNTKSIIENKTFHPKYYGAIAIRTQFKAKDVSGFNINNISLVMGSNAHLVLYPTNQSKEFNLVCIIRQKPGSNKDIKQTLESTIFKQNINLINLFKEDLKSWSIHTSYKAVKSIYKNVFYIGDAFYAFPPTMAQGASQAIESAYEIFNLIEDNNLDIQNVYFNNRLKRTNIVIKRSKFNYLIFHISNPVLKIFRNTILKILIKNKKFIKSYLGKVYK